MPAFCQEIPVHSFVKQRKPNVIKWFLLWMTEEEWRIRKLENQSGWISTLAVHRKLILKESCWNQKQKFRYISFYFQNRNPWKDSWCLLFWACLEQFGASKELWKCFEYCWCRDSVLWRETNQLQLTSLITLKLLVDATAWWFLGFAFAYIVSFWSSLSHILQMKSDNSKLSAEHFDKITCINDEICRWGSLQTYKQITTEISQSWYLSSVNWPGLTHGPELHFPHEVTLPQRIVQGLLSGETSGSLISPKLHKFACGNSYSDWDFWTIG